MHLAELGLLDHSHVLAGIPHPSGANAERVAVFLGRKDPSLASRQTNPVTLLEAFKSLKKQITSLKSPTQKELSSFSRL
jgi:hypothetical protein